MDRTERALDQSGIAIAPPMRVRAVTQTIAPAPAPVPSTRIRKQEPTGSETESSESEGEGEGGEIQVDDGQIGDSELGGGDEMGEGVGDGDMGDYGDGDFGMGYMDSWPGDAGYTPDPDAMVEDSIQKPQDAQYHAGAHVELPSSFLQVPRADHHVIPLDPDAIVNHFGTPCKPKRGRSRADSVESRQSKVNRQSASHSSAGIQSTMVSTGAQSPSSAIPSTKVSTRPQSPSRSGSPVGLDLQGASRTTGGIFQGRALGESWLLLLSQYVGTCLDPIVYMSRQH